MMKHNAGIFDECDPEAEAASFVRARADMAAGRVHDHAVVSEWLLTWGKPTYKPFQEWLVTRHV